MKPLKIKVITGFREDQQYTIDGDEAHKAYYLFLNPEMRGVFKNGVALVGKNIQGIEPDYNATMGWNISHRLESDDWNELNEKGITNSMRDLLGKAKEVAYAIPNNQKLLNIPLGSIGKDLTQISNHVLLQ